LKLPVPGPLSAAEPRAVAITDTIQLVLVCLTLAVAGPLLMHEVGSFDAVAEFAPDAFFAPFGGIPVFLTIAHAATGISILVDPGFYQRIFAAKDLRQARNAMLIAINIAFAYDWLATAGGMMAAAAVDAADRHVDDRFLRARCGDQRCVRSLAAPGEAERIRSAGRRQEAVEVEILRLSLSNNLYYDKTKR